jgi:hypothetical protein
MVSRKNGSIVIDAGFDLLERLRSDAQHQQTKALGAKPSAREPGRATQSKTAQDTAIPDYEELLRHGSADIPTLVKRLRHEIEVGFATRASQLRPVLDEVSGKCDLLFGPAGINGDSGTKAAALRTALARALDRLEDLMEIVLVKK